MQTRILFPMVVCLSLTFSTGVGADERQNAASLARLLVEIQQVVPDGWEADFQLVDPQYLTREGKHPAIDFKSPQPLPIEFINYPNSPFRVEGEPDPPPELHEWTIFVRLVAYPYMSPEERTRARAENDRMIQKRVDFEKEHLQHIECGFKGVAPTPPQFYHPEGKAETLLIMQYSFLWAATEPRLLPTHHTDDLAIDMSFLPLNNTKIHDDRKAREYAQFLSSLETIIVPYETER